jgi:hypothetical protein
MTKTHDEAMAVALDVPLRANVATLLKYQHEERMGRILAPPHETYEITQKSPAGKTGGFEFSVSGPDADVVEAKTLEWAEKFPSPQPAPKP